MLTMRMYTLFLEAWQGVKALDRLSNHDFNTQGIAAARIDQPLLLNSRR